MRLYGLKVGLALGGGAARGLAHVGVLRALSREKIPIHVLTGTSMGAIIGGSWVASGDVVKLEERVREVLSSEEFRRNRLSFLKETKRQRGGLLFSVGNLVRRGIFFGVSNLRPSFLSAERFAGSMEAILPDVPIEGLNMPFGAVTLDIGAGEEVLLTRGKLRRAAAASSAIPGVLPPVELGGRRLIDGGWVDKIPVLPAFRLGADVVIAVDITADLQNGGEYRRGVDIMVRANALKDDALVSFSRQLADLVIAPDVGQVHWADFGAFDQCIERGDEAAMRVIPKIKSLLSRERILRWFRRRMRRRMAEQFLAHGERKLWVE